MFIVCVEAKYKNPLWLRADLKETSEERPSEKAWCFNSVEGARCAAHDYCNERRRDADWEMYEVCRLDDSRAWEDRGELDLGDLDERRLRHRLRLVEQGWGGELKDIDAMPKKPDDDYYDQYKERERNMDPDGKKADFRWAMFLCTDIACNGIACGLDEDGFEARMARFVEGSELEEIKGFRFGWNSAAGKVYEFRYPAGGA